MTTNQGYIVHTPTLRAAAQSVRETAPPLIRSVQETWAGCTPALPGSSGQALLDCHTRLVANGIHGTHLQPTADTAGGLDTNAQNYENVEKATITSLGDMLGSPRKQG